jgi:hypothetical protein
MPDTPLNEVVNEIVVDTAYEIIPMAAAPKKWSAIKTAWSYLKTMLAGAGKIAPIAFVLGTPPSLAQQQELVKRPDEHIASQSHPLEAILEASNTIEDDLVSVVQAPAFDTAQVRTKTRAQVMLDTSPQPLPLITEVKVDEP